MLFFKIIKLEMQVSALVFATISLNIFRLFNFAWILNFVKAYGEVIENVSPEKKLCLTNVRLTIWSLYKQLKFNANSKLNKLCSLASDNLISNKSLFLFFPGKNFTVTHMQPAKDSFLFFSLLLIDEKSDFHLNSFVKKIMFSSIL